MSKILKRLYTIVGNVTLDHVRQMNPSGEAWVKSIESNATRAEQSDSRIKKVKIRGAKSHKSTDDPSDPLQVISLQYLNEQETRIRSEHIHEDGTAKSK